MGSEEAGKGLMQDAGVIRMVFLEDRFGGSVMGMAGGRAPTNRILQ